MGADKNSCFFVPRGMCFVQAKQTGPEKDGLSHRRQFTPWSRKAGPYFGAQASQNVQAFG